MKRRLGFVLLGLIFGAASITAFFGSDKKADVETGSLWVELKPEQALTDRISLPSFAPLVKRVEPAVLVVSTESVSKQSPKRKLPPELENSPFREFFHFYGPQDQQERKRVGQGSGFIIHPTGYALTNHHVVEGATTISVKVGKELALYEAEVIGSDETTDVALIKIKSNRKNWPVVPLGSSDTIQVGDFAVAIGNPMGLELSVSMGIVSARGRRDIHPSGRTGLYDFIQIDNPINPGNSGGPLLNLAGEVIGINTAISAVGQGIAFAIPINQVKQILPQLKASGTVSRSWLGVQIQEVTQDLAKASGLASPHGAVIREVMSDSPAKKAGIEAGDIITEFDGKIVESAGSLQVFAGLAGVGKKVEVTLYRDGKPRKAMLTLEEMPKDGKVTAEITPPKGTATDVDALGISVVTLDGAMRKKLMLDNSVHGAVITKVDQGAIAAMAGLEVNDVIVKLNNSAVTDAAALAKGIKGVPEGGMLRLLLRRGKQTIFIAINKP